MARIAGINLPNHKHIEIGLTSIYGIGRSTAQKICDAAGVPRNTKVQELSEDQAEKLRARRWLPTKSRVTCAAKFP